MRIIVPLLALLIFSSCGNTFYIVRHAEKARPLAGMSAMEASDPPLSDSGQLRAIQLREALKNHNIQYIFSTNYKRTISTAQPLNELRGVTRIEIYSAKKDSTDAFIKKLKLIKKDNVLIVGHSNTVDDIANMLCGSTVVPGDLKDAQYDNLFVVKRKGSKYVFTGRKYGTPTE
jgi:broad specificity phosphatase PhoE